MEINRPDSGKYISLYELVRPYFVFKSPEYKEYPSEWFEIMREIDDRKWIEDNIMENEDYDNGYVIGNGKRRK